VTVTLLVMEFRRTLNGGLAGALAAGVWAAQQPLDKRLFRSDYDDVEMLGKLVTRGPAWPAAGLAMHLANGAAVGAGYALARPFIPGPGLAAGAVAALAENFGSWPLALLIDRHHPARDDLETLAGNTRVLALSTWRHLLFGLILGELERRLNPEDEFEPPSEVPVSSNGHGNIERAAAAAT
jgi:hypothetical protein